MILVIFIVSVIILIAGIAIYFATDNGVAGFSSCISGVIAFVSLIALICLFVSAVGAAPTKDKIEMYETSNAQIDAEIDSVVNNYMAYEKETFKELQPNSGKELVQLFPELKSDAIVQKQLETYYDNQKKVRELKEEELAARYIRWWLYFGWD